RAEQVDSHSDEIRLDPTIIRRSPTGKGAHHHIIRTLIVDDLIDRPNGNVVLGYSFRTDGILWAIGILRSIPHVASIISCRSNNGIERLCKSQIINLLAFRGIKAKAIFLPVVDAFITGPCPVAISVLVPADQIAV